jgi:L-amino acid N-acyltransferase YncA
VNYSIDRMKPCDWYEVRAIYLEGIATGYATLETDPGTWEKWDAAHLQDHRFVARRDSSVSDSATDNSSIGNSSVSDSSCNESPTSGSSPSGCAASDPSFSGSSVKRSSVLGWASLSPVSNRPVYAGVVEVSVYVASKFQGQGIGRALLEALIASAEKSGIWTLQAAIFPENRASLALHLKSGFREVGRREKLGKLHEKWHDVLLLERRSKVAGISD